MRRLVMMLTVTFVVCGTENVLKNPITEKFRLPSFE
jgi:hypothetical protein